MKNGPSCLVLNDLDQFFRDTFAVSSENLSSVVN